MHAVSEARGGHHLDQGGSALGRGKRARRSTVDQARLRRTITRSADPIARIEAWCEHDAHWQTVLEDVVRHARDAGYSWQEIGDALGISKQAAQKRWHPIID